MNDSILDQCATFELRGPNFSLARVSPTNVVMMRAETDWSDVLKGRPLVDNRNSNMRDLFPSPRDMLRSLSVVSNNHSDGPKLRGLG